MPTLPRVRGEYAKSEGRRREIVEAAFAIFATVGYRGSSMRAIARRVGMSQPGITHHFGSKDELLAAVLELRDERSLAAFGGGESAGIDTLRGLIRLAEHNQAEPELVALHCILSAEATRADHPAHEYFRRRYAALVELLRAGFDVLQRDGELRDGVDPASAARGALAHMDGLQVQWLLDRANVDMAGGLRDYLRLLVRIEI